MRQFDQRSPLKAADIASSKLDLEQIQKNLVGVELLTSYFTNDPEGCRRVRSKMLSASPDATLSPDVQVTRLLSSR